MRRMIAVLALLLAAFALKGLLLAPPAPDPRAAFNSERAVDRLARSLGDQRPHPVDSAANDAVRGRLMTELRAIGLQPEVRELQDCRSLPRGRTVSCSFTRNIVAVIAADKPGKALLLNAHYDSTPTGPGAADDGIGVATLLEVAADLQRRPPAQPVILLFNEGEEYGLNGAGAFVEGDPLAARVGSLINIESRGVSGPAFMFETSEPNGPAIQAFAAATSRPYANSLTADFAKLIPNYTDVVVFKHEGWKTLSYAIVGNETRYHSPGDRVEHLDRSSAQHMGNEVLAAVRTLPSADGAGQRVYTDLAGRLFFDLDFIVAEILVGLLIGGAFYLAWQRRGLGRPLFVCFVAIAAGVAVAFASTFVAGFIRPGDYWRATPLVSFMAVYASVLAAMVAVLGIMAASLRPRALRSACWLAILITGGLLSIFVHGAMIFFIAAPALALLAMAVDRLRPWLLWVAALLQLLMFAQLMASIELLLIDGPLWSVAPLAALAALPFLVEATRAPWKWPAAALAAVALTLWVAALVVPRSSAERPLAFTIDYVRDDADGTAKWAVASKQAPLPPAFGEIGKWSRGTLPYSGRTRWLADAPLLEIPTAGVSTAGVAMQDGRRVVRVRLDRGGADSVMIRFDPGSGVQAMGKSGSPWKVDGGGTDEPYILRCTGRTCDGLLVDIVTSSPKPIEGKLVAIRFGLPLEGQAIAARRPADAHPQYGPDSTIRSSAIRI